MTLSEAVRGTIGLVVPSMRLQYLTEPLLMFGNRGLHVDPRAGIARFGPYAHGTPRHPQVVRIGFIGTAESIDLAQSWMQKLTEGIAGNEDHPEFPGFTADRGFFTSLVFDPNAIERITQNEIASLMGRGARQRARFEATVQLIGDKLRMLAERDLAPQYVVFALPEEIERKCKTVDYKDPTLGSVHRDLRRALKAVAMKYRLPTQIVRTTTTTGKDKTPASKIAWNYMTGLYFKAGGVPWAPHGLSAGTCYVGISFYRPLGSNWSRMQTSLVQAFDEHGDGLVLRGHDFEWDTTREDSRSPHLSAEQTTALVEMVLDRYTQEMKQAPKRVVVHKRSRYWPAERDGFKQAFWGRVHSYDLVALARQDEARLFPANEYPPLRGTRFSVDDLDYLYTTGFIAALGEYHGMHVPSPVQIADHVGSDTGRDTLLREILALTKMNWNSASFGGRLPITLKFAELVGDILREVPSDQEPLPQFKFYM